jgi:hypothetical protein
VVEVNLGNMLRTHDATADLAARVIVGQSNFVTSRKVAVARRCHVVVDGDRECGSCRDELKRQMG